MKASEITCNGRHSCVLRRDKKVACWGWNGNGELGIGSSTNVGTSSSSMGVNMQLVDLGSGMVVNYSTKNLHTLKSHFQQAQTPVLWRLEVHTLARCVAMAALYAGEPILTVSWESEVLTT